MMQRGLFLLYIICILFESPLLAQADQDYTIDEIARMESRRWRGDEMKGGDTFNGGNYDWLYAECIWNIDPWLKYISGTVTHTIELLEPADRVSFDLSSAMQINQILVDGELAQYSFTDALTLEIELGSLVQPGVLIIAIAYEGEPIPQLNTSFYQSFHGADGGVPEIYTLSEPYGSRDWWPCKHTLNDKVDSIFIEITVPEGNKAGSNGKLLYEQNNGDGTVSFGWKHRYPIPAYLVSLAVTNYAEFSQIAEVDDQEIHILSYVYPERYDIEFERSQVTPSFMTLFSEKFGMYPYADEKYGHAQSSIGGGMEHTTMSTMANMSYSLVAHELAHQWFGDMLTCGSWADIWLNEGFATFATGLVFENLGNPGEWLSWRVNSIDQVLAYPDGAVYVDDTLSRDRIFDGRLSYRKGALVLHMLRGKLGDDVFFEGVRNYRSNPNLAYSYVRTADFQESMETVSGEDLNEFFQDWIYGEGFPTYEVVWWPIESGIGVKINQQTSHASVDFYEMSVELKILGLTTDTTIVLNNDYNGQVFSVNPGFETLNIEFDPNFWLVAESAVRLDVENDFQDFLITPNPGKDLVRISILNPYFNAEKVEIVDIQGRVIESRTPPMPVRSGFDFSISHLNPGTYYLRLISGGTSKTIPFVKI